MDIIPFTFQENRIRTILINDNPYFVAKDLAKVLGLKDSKGAIRDLRNRYIENNINLEGVILTHPLKTEGGTQNLTILSEIGLYEFIFASRKPVAVIFRHWVASEVLPQIRKTGSFSLEAEKEKLAKIRERAELLEISEKEFGIFEEVFYKIGITRKEELAITTNRAVKKETGVDFIELAEKKGISTSEKYFTVTELCQKVMDSDKFSDETKKLVSTKAGDKPRPQNLNKILESHGFQTKIDGVWKPTEKAKDFSDFVQNKSQYSEKTVFHTVWKVEVLEEIF